jgi:hypothetical protein
VTGPSPFERIAQIAGRAFLSCFLGAVVLIVLPPPVWAPLVALDGRVRGAAGTLDPRLA